MIRKLNLVSSLSLIALIALCLAWELWLAPLRPGGSMLVLKTLPLLLPLMGILKGRRYTYQWASLLILLYVGEGLLRATSDAAVLSRQLGVAETVLTLVFFASTAWYAKLTGSKANLHPVKHPPGD
ncbi:MAG: DUF2069 domain-containing protein [Rhodocyclaceae bacterium]|nr:MAG: DUF2069 domain-containing protein [Rhodocyclaceae bacterium]